MSTKDKTERGESEHEAAAMRAYSSWSGNHPTIHCNRFPAWHELTEGERAIWRKKATLTAPPAEKVSPLRDVAVATAAPQAGGEWWRRHCQTGNADVCRASQRDGVICADDECDIDNGIRPPDAAPQPPAAQAGDGDGEPHWAPDCQGKWDYDGVILRVSSRYWPGNYRQDGKPSAESAILDAERVVAKRKFVGETETEVKAAVEAWVREQRATITTTPPTDSAAREAAVAELIAACDSAPFFSKYCDRDGFDFGHFQNAYGVHRERVRRALAALQPVRVTEEKVVIRRTDAENLARFALSNAGNGVRSVVKGSAHRVLTKLQLDGDT